MVRGRFVVRDGALVGKETAGEYVAREKSPLAQPRGVNYGGFRRRLLHQGSKPSAGRSASVTALDHQIDRNHLLNGADGGVALGEHATAGGAVAHRHTHFGSGVAA